MVEPALNEEQTGEGKKKTIIIGLSGPSSSGKTTLARLLRTIFGADERVRTFIIHEDDFYYPDDKVPVTKTTSGDLIQDWDTINAIDVSFLASALAYVRQYGKLPPRLKSKEDRNEASDPGVNSSRIEKHTKEVGERLRKRQQEMNGEALTVIFLEGFLLYAPPESEEPQHILRPIHDNIHLHLFLPAPYDLVKSRREARSGYATIGPAPIPTDKPQENKQQQERVVNLEKEDDGEPQNFWTDPSGYVDDIVWPRYIQDHAWLLLPEQDNASAAARSLAAQLGSKNSSEDSTVDKELLRLAGQGTNIRTEAGVKVAPGKGKIPIAEILDWAVQEALRCLEAEDLA